MSLAPELGAILRHHDSELAAIAQDDASDRRTAPPGAAEPPIVPLGRIAAARRALLRRLGHDLSREDWESLFNGSDGVLLADAPDAEVLFADAAANGQLLAAHLEEMSGEDGEREWCARVAGETTSTAGALAWHAAAEGRELGRLCALSARVARPTA